MSKRKTIFRRPHASKFFSVDRSTAQNKDLSYEAAGMLTYILSKSDTWEVRPSDLERKGCGRNRVYRLLNELIVARYIVRDVERDENGKITAFIYIVYETPFPENQEMANQEMENGDNREYREEQSTEIKDSAPKNSAVTSARKRDPWYDAVEQIWDYSGALNKMLCQMLQGKATQKGYKDCNLTIELSPDDVTKWAAWYRATELRGDASLTMVQSPAKIQSSLNSWDKQGRPDGTQNDPYEEMFRGLKLIVAGES